MSASAGKAGAGLSRASSAPRFCLSALFWLLSSATVAHAATLAPISLIAGGLEREALIHYPESASAGPLPVMFAFHGHGGTMESAQRAFQCESLWPEALVVYPQGLPTPGGVVDPQGRRSGWQLNQGDHDDRDLALFDALLSYLRARVLIDASRIYVVGHSNGAVFAYLLWAARGDEIAAICPIAGIIPTGVDRTKLEPMPVFHVAGRNDRVVRFAWQAETMAFVREINGCGDAPPVIDGYVSVYSSRSGAATVAYVDDGGHAIPEGVMPLAVRFFKDTARGGRRKPRRAANRRTANRRAAKASIQS